MVKLLRYGRGLQDFNTFVNRCKKGPDGPFLLLALVDMHLVQIATSRQHAFQIVADAANFQNQTIQFGSI